jgi:hypothetical protein
MDREIKVWHMSAITRHTVTELDETYKARETSDTITSSQASGHRQSNGKLQKWQLGSARRVGCGIHSSIAYIR